MGFSDFQFLPRDGAGRDPRRFPGHREVHCYLPDFCAAFGLMDAVRLNTRVVRVAPTSTTTRQRQWAVRSVRRLGGPEDGARVEEEEEEVVFDAVVVATGQYSHPMLPSGIEGVGEWRRRQLHSRLYRTPEPFRGEAVVVVGCGDSGTDIALDLRRVAREVHLAASSEAATPAVSRMVANHGDVLRLHPRVRRLHADGRVSFADGSSVVADTVFFCTGYGYSFPFLDTGGAVAVGDGGCVVAPLFEASSTCSRRPWRRRSPSWACRGRSWCRGSSRRRRGGSRRRCPAAARCRRRRRCCGPWRSTSAPGRPPACRGSTPTTAPPHRRH
uniref:Flavin-containing monooxygenase n=1 Tax=Aegilops tauschii subsp. strangulata TaxID=200361 RepID=A0A453LAU6_AEGTS